jgi:hypothetical protein
VGLSKSTSERSMNRSLSAKITLSFTEQYQVLICLRLALRAFELAGRRP